MGEWAGPRSCGDVGWCMGVWLLTRWHAMAWGRVTDAMVVQVGGWYKTGVPDIHRFKSRVSLA